MRSVFQVIWKLCEQKITENQAHRHTFARALKTCQVRPILILSAQGGGFNPDNRLYLGMHCKFLAFIKCIKSKLHLLYLIWKNKPPAYLKRSRIMSVRLRVRLFISLADIMISNPQVAGLHLRLAFILVCAVKTNPRRGPSWQRQGPLCGGYEMWIISCSWGVPPPRCPLFSPWRISALV